LELPFDLVMKLKKLAADVNRAEAENHVAAGGLPASSSSTEAREQKHLMS